jgi:hypothetical protein
VGSADGSSGDAGRVAYFALAQPCGQPGGADAADPLWAGIPGQQDKGTLAGRVVERSFQGGEHAGHEVSEPVDHPHPVSDQVGPVASQHRQVADQVGVAVDDG